jgi:lysozyme family protein
MAVRSIQGVHVSTFKEAFDFVMQHEDPQRSGAVTVDAGGRTRFGIAQLFHPDLQEDFFTCPAEEAMAQAEKIYEREYWRPARLADIGDQSIANKIFDMVVNMGEHQAVRIAQRAINCMGAGCLAEDGVPGDQTLSAINGADAVLLHQMLCALMRDYYLHVATVKPSQQKYLAGWLKRAEA